VTDHRSLGLRAVQFPKLFPTLPDLDSLTFTRQAGETPGLSSLPIDPDAIAADQEPEAIAWTHLLEDPVPSSGRVLWITMLVALVGHGVLAFIPTNDARTVAPPNPKEKKIRIVQLPVPGQPAAKAPSPVPARPIAPQQRPIVQRPATTRPIVQRPTPRRPTPPAPKAQTPQPKPTQTPATQTPPPTTTTPATTTTTTTTPPATSGNPWQDFPQYPGAQPGCYNLQSCMKTGKSLAEVSAFFEKELVARKYTIQPAPSSGNDTRAYQVSRDGLTQFLSILTVEGEGAIYVVSEQPRTLADLTQAVEVPGEIYSVLGNLAAEDATAANLGQPDAFYPAGVQQPGIGALKLIPGEDPNTFFDAYFRTNLVNNGFEISDSSQSYGGGPVYKVKKGDLVMYLNLVPTADNAGTVVVVWRVRPQ